MRKVHFVNFGSANPSDVRQLSLTGPCYGIRIASDSEIDQCRICEGGKPDLSLWLEGQADDLDYVVSESSADPKSHKVSVARPLVGMLNPGGNRVDLLVAPTRATFTAAQLASPTRETRAATLILEILDDPMEAHMPAPRCRAPLDVDFTMIVDANGGSIYVPMFGRKSWSVEVDSLILTGAGVVSTQGTALRGIWYPVAGVTRLREWSLWTAVAGDTEKEGEGDIDWIKINVDLDSGTSAAAIIHVRAEDE